MEISNSHILRGVGGEAAFIDFQYGLCDLYKESCFDGKW